MFLTAFVFFAVLLGVLFMHYIKTNKERTAWNLFYSRGKDSGFSVREMELLRRVAVQEKLEEPSAIFYSLERLEFCIKSLVRSTNLGDMDDQDAIYYEENQNLLSKLFDFRQRIEMDKPTGRSDIYHSRQISEGQNLRVLVEGSGVYRSQVVKNDNENLIISLPISNRANGSSSWVGKKISLYFWREEDAGYVFDTEVIDELFAKGLASLKVIHSDSLFRTQKRKSIRIKVNKPAYLYLLEDDAKAFVPETEPGLNCYMEDISDSGCAITVGGLGESDLRIKVQFELNSNPIIMSGTVRSVAYKEDINRSLLRVEADTLPIETRNKILAEVFGTTADDDDDLPFKLISEEAEAMYADRGIGAMAKGDVNMGISFN